MHVEGIGTGNFRAAACRLGGTEIARGLLLGWTRAENMFNVWWVVIKRQSGQTRMPV